MNEKDYTNAKNRCPKVKCNDDCCPVFRKVTISAAMGSDEPGQPFAPENGAYENALVYYEASGVSYIYSSDGLYTKIAIVESDSGVISVNGKTGVVEITLAELGGKTQEEIQQMINNAVSGEAGLRSAADNSLQGQIDALAASSDVTDIVGTYADLQAYDTSKLKNNDIVKVLQDETHDDETTYYRWSTSTETFSLIGEEGPYYTKSAADQKFQEKLIAGTNISIASDGKTISSTASQTIFYESASASGNTRNIYKKSDMTDPATAQDLLDANEKGQVILRLSTVSTPEYYSDAYLQNTYTGNADYQFLFLNERSYRQFDATDPSDTTFYFTASEIQLKLSAGSNISITGNTISATDTTYSDFTGTDGVTAGVHGLVPAPATTDADKFLKSDGTWDTAGGGGGDSVYSTKTTSNSATGGAVYIGNKGTDQVPVLDPSPNDNHFKYFWALPYSNNGNTYGQPGSGSVNILGSAKGINTVAIGSAAGAGAYGAAYAVMIGSSANAGPSGISIGDNSGTNQDYNGVVCIGTNSTAGYGAHYSVALGHGARPSRKGEVNVGATGTNGFNNTTYRVIGGVYDGQDAHDAVTVDQINNLIDAINTAAGTNISHIGS